VRKIKMKAHDTEKPLSSPKELEPGEWCENYPGNRQVYLHPVKDELFVIKNRGQLGRWRYTPELTYEDGFETTHITSLEFSSDGDWFAMLASSLGRIEIRSTSDLSCLRQIQNDHIYKYSCEMRLSQDGRWLVLDACKNYDKRGEEDGAAWIDLQTGETIFRSWTEINHNIELEDEFALIIGQMEFSPDQKQLSVNIWYNCSIV
jgi:WD40 repeat protein